MELSRQDLGLMQLLPEPMLLVRGGRVVAANAAAGKLLGRAPGMLRGLALAELVEDAPATQAYLTACSRTRQFLPGAISWRLGGAVQRLRCDAAALAADAGDLPPLLLMRIRTEADPSGRFTTLTEKVDALAREVRRRQQAEEQLRGLTATLEQQVAERAALAERRAGQLRALAMALSQAEQRERRRLAQALHDDLQQLLVAARMRAGMITDSGTGEDLRQSVAMLDGVLINCIALSRSLTIDLSPPVLYDAGLAAGLSWLARWMAETHRLDVSMQIEGQIEPSTEAMRVLVFQLVRELLMNVVKHAEIPAAAVCIARTAAGLTVTIEDKGRGFAMLDAEAGTPGRFGLFHVRERVDAIGGEFHLQSALGEGTRVRMSIPLQTDESPAEGDEPQALDGESSAT